MCIGDTKNCVVLSREEQLAQHNFEERKGPYPTALAVRLDAEGYMTTLDHMALSCLERSRNLRLFGLGYSHMSEEEFAYVSGTSHTSPPVDPYAMSVAEQEQIRDLCSKERRKRFHDALVNRYGSLGLLLEYPESIGWICEMLESGECPLQRLVRRLRLAPEFFPVLAPHLDRKLLLDAVATMIEKMSTSVSYTGKRCTKRRSNVLAEVAHLMVQGVDAALFSAFQALVDTGRRIKQMPTGNQAQRRNRKKLIKENCAEFHRFFRELSQDNGNWLLDHILAGFREQLVPPERLAA